MSLPIFLLFEFTAMGAAWKESTPEGLRPPQYSERGGDAGYTVLPVELAWQALLNAGVSPAECREADNSESRKTVRWGLFGARRVSRGGGRAYQALFAALTVRGVVGLPLYDGLPWFPPIIDHWLAVVI